MEDFAQPRVPLLRTARGLGDWPINITSGEDDLILPSLSASCGVAL